MEISTFVEITLVSFMNIDYNKHMGNVTGKQNVQ